MWNTLQTEAQQLLQKTDRVGQHPGLKVCSVGSREKVYDVDSD